MLDQRGLEVARRRDVRRRGAGAGSQAGATLGKVTFAWQAGDTDTIGEHNVEWRVTFPSGKKATFPRGTGVIFNKVVIQDEVV